MLLGRESERVCCWVVKDTLGAERDALAARVPSLSVCEIEGKRVRVYVSSVARERESGVCVCCWLKRGGRELLPGGQGHARRRA